MGYMSLGCVRGGVVQPTTISMYPGAFHQLKYPILPVPTKRNIVCVNFPVFSLP
jgi:hypothetical protein